MTSPFSPLTSRVSLILLLATASLAFADSKIVRQTTESSPVAGLTHRHIELEDSTTGDRVTFELAIFSPKSCTLRVIDNPDGNSDLSSAMQHSGDGLAGVNGGYFDPAFAPLGLRIVSGKTTSRLTKGRLMSGLLISGPEFCQVLRVGEFSAHRKQHVDAAVECGPFLVDSGKPVPGLESTRSARRTFAAVTTSAPNDQRAMLGYCSDATLAGLGRMLAALGQSEPDLKIQRALNMDGGSSSAFWFKRADAGARPFSIAESKFVRDFVAIAPK